MLRPLGLAIRGGSQGSGELGMGGWSWSEAQAPQQGSGAGSTLYSQATRFPVLSRRVSASLPTAPALVPSLSVPGANEASVCEAD